MISIISSYVFTLGKYIFFLYICKKMIDILYFIYKNFIRQRIDIKSRYGENSWALITGATDGIGKGFCEELAKEGFNIILVARNKAKLAAVANELGTKFGVNTHSIEFDFTQKSKVDDYVTSFGQLNQNYDISILVNNVGTNIRGTMNDLTLENYNDIINLNILPQTFLTKIFADGLTERSKRSAVIDLSSFSSVIPSPCRAVYTATKSYNYLLSRALAEEYEKDNIDFLCVKPMLVETPLTKVKADGSIIITANNCASGSLDDLGYEKETYGHWKHKIQAGIFNMLPFILQNYLMNTVLIKTIKANKQH